MRNPPERVAAIVAENRLLRLRLQEVESELGRLVVRWSDVETKNNMLANLYVAISQLHCTLGRPQVLEALSEIIIGLIGSECFAVYERSDDGRVFRVAVSQGVDDPRDLDLESDPLARLLAAGQRSIAGSSDQVDLDMPVAVALPLRLDGCVTGGIVLFTLLAQKGELLDADFELFDILELHAAIALRSTAIGEVAA